jgi:2,3-dihydroxyphenylpropionate 1,2-dioxygenase
MTLAVCCTLHSPLLEFTDPGPELTAHVETAFATARDFVRDYDPELVIVSAPDHYNGFFDELMPPFCVGLEATSIGTTDPRPGRSTCPGDIALACATSAFDDGAR